MLGFSELLGGVTPNLSRYHPSRGMFTMSSIDDAYARGLNADLTQGEWFPDLFNMYPNIAQMLVGGPDWKRNVQQRPPFTLMISERNGRLAATFSHFDRPKIIKLSVDKPSDLLWSIEEALKQGRFTVDEKQDKSARR